MLWAPCFLKRFDQETRLEPWTRIDPLHHIIAFHRLGRPPENQVDFLDASGVTLVG